MDWVEAQLDEVTSKLTNLPKVFVILPDFTGVFDGGWSDFRENFDALQNESINENTQEREQLETERNALTAYKETLDCNGEDSFECISVDLQL